MSAGDIQRDVIVKPGGERRQAGLGEVLLEMRSDPVLKGEILGFAVLDGEPENRPRILQLRCAPSTA